MVPGTLETARGRSHRDRLATFRQTVIGAPPVKTAVDRARKSPSISAHDGRDVAPRVSCFRIIIACASVKRVDQRLTDEPLHLCGYAAISSTGSRPRPATRGRAALPSAATALCRDRPPVITHLLALARHAPTLSPRPCAGPPGFTLLRSG